MTLSAVRLKGIYATGSEPLLGFYEDCLRQSVAYDRAAGYFSSTLYAAAQLAISNFVEREGRMRLICSPHLRQEDFAAMEAGLSLREAVSNSIQDDIARLLGDGNAAPGIRFLATLIAEDRLDIKLAYSEVAQPGLFHTKVGVFTDANGSQVAFIGSANETWSAWSDVGNHESFVAFATWTNSIDSQRVSDLAEYFELLWSGLQPGVVVRDIPDAPKEFLLGQADEEGVDAARSSLLNSMRGEPERKQIGKVLLPHQSAVLRSWHEAGEKGVVAHVTGAGKTITAIAAIREWLAKDQPVLVIVPRTLLQTQWRDELRKELSDQSPNLLLAGGRGSRAAWIEGLPDQTRRSASLGKRVTIAVADTAASDDFRRRCKAGPHLLVVADEAHNYGSSQGLQMLDGLEASRARLGLSATLERSGDPLGTEGLRDFFGSDLLPSFGISEAIAAGRLVPYHYEINTVSLGEDEETRYEALTDRIRRSIHFDDPTEPSEFLRLLLIKRARILKKAAAKPTAAAEIVRANFREGQHWLLYCDDTEQMGQVIAALQERGFQPLEYHSAMGSTRDITLGTFIDLGGILTAIRCLDEGVDLPVLDHAVILASSTNPREYIQRRGRVLRWQPGKPLAFIWDMVVLDSEGIPVNVNEIGRARLFASDAFNFEASVEVDELYRRGVAAGRFDVDIEDEDENENEGYNDD